MTECGAGVVECER